MSEKNERKNNFINTFRSGKMKIAQKILFFFIIIIIILFIYFLFIYLFFCWSTFPSGILNERPPEIGANPALYSNQQTYPSRGPTNHRKGAEKWLFSSCLLAQQRWCRLYMLVCDQKYGMFVATCLTVKRKWCEILSIFNGFLYVVC